MTESDDPRWLSERDVVELLDLPSAIDAVSGYLALEAAGEAVTMEKTHVAWNGGHTLHALGGVASGASLAGTKTWAHTGGGATPLLVLWDADSGRLRAVIEAFALGQLRTASMSGVATRWSARPDASTMAVIGTGKQAIAQVAAVAAVRPIRHVVAFSPTVEHRDRFVARVAGAGLGVQATAATSVAEAVAGADVITTVTRATEPFLRSADVSPGTHVNAVGAITPERRELTPEVLDRCSLIAADSVAAAVRLASELRDVAPDRIVPLSAVVAGTVGRPVDADLTLFKAMGIGLADLALGDEVLRRAVAQGRGRRFPHPERLDPRLTLDPSGLDLTALDHTGSPRG